MPKDAITDERLDPIYSHLAGKGVRFFRRKPGWKGRDPFWDEVEPRHGMLWPFSSDESKGADGLSRALAERQRAQRAEPCTLIETPIRVPLASPCEPWALDPPIVYVDECYMSRTEIEYHRRRRS
jgi:hypothetical protein